MYYSLLSKTNLARIYEVKFFDYIHNPLRHFASIQTRLQIKRSQQIYLHVGHAANKQRFTEAKGTMDKKKRHSLSNKPK